MSQPMFAAAAPRAPDAPPPQQAPVARRAGGAAVGVARGRRGRPRGGGPLGGGGGGAGGRGAPPPPVSRASRTLAQLALSSARTGRPSPAPLLFSAEFRRDHPDRVRELVEPFAKYRPSRWTTQFQTIATS